MELKLGKKEGKELLVDPNEFYKMGDQEQQQYIKTVKSYIASNELFKRMDNIVRRNLKSYKNDFYIHDVYSISQDNGDFVWLIRDCGTELFRCNNDSFTKDGQWSGLLWFNAVELIGKVKHYYFYDSKKGKLSKIKQEKAREIVEKFNQLNLEKNN